MFTLHELYMMMLDDSSMYTQLISMTHIYDKSRDL